MLGYYLRLACKRSPTLHRGPSGAMDCWGSARVDTYQQLLSSECTWLTLWVELSTTDQRARFLDFVNAYWAQQHQQGRFMRPRNNELWQPAQWLRMHGVVGSESPLLLELAFAFLAVCLINTVGVLLAKFLRGAAVTGVRRALGASHDFMGAICGGCGMPLYDTALLPEMAGDGGFYAYLVRARPGRRDALLRAALQHIGTAHRDGVINKAMTLSQGLVVLGATGQLAAWQPARRAASVSPSVATRTV